MGRIWDDVIGEEERALYRQAGYGRPAGFGLRPALMLVDLYVTDVDAREGDRFRDPLPPGSEDYLPAVQRLVQEARARQVPAFYSTNQYRADGRDMIGWKHKSWRAEGHCRALEGRPVPFIPAVAPRPEDWVILKQRPSAFFGTPLAGYLIDLQIDTLLVGGQATSGCVRATVLDAFSYGFRTIVVEDCTFDRATVSHKVNLFDMHQKYADVRPLEEVLAYLAGLPRPGPSAS
jgi:nicotinamidase-related amidase